MCLYVLWQRHIDTANTLSADLVYKRDRSCTKVVVITQRKRFIFMDRSYSFFINILINKD